MKEPEWKLKMVDMIRDKKDILFGQYSPFVTKVLKHKTWEEILTAVNAIGANLTDVGHLRRKQWDNMRRATQKKLLQLNQTGGKPVKLNELDLVIADIIGRDQPHQTGHGLKDDPPTKIHSVIVEDVLILEAGDGQVPTASTPEISLKEPQSEALEIFGISDKVCIIKHLR